MKFEFEITEKDLDGYFKSIVRDKIKAFVSKKFDHMMGDYWIEHMMMEGVKEAIKKRSDVLVPKLLENKTKMDEIAQEAVTKHMMAKIKRNIKKMEGA